MKDLTGLKLLAKFPIENIWMLAVDGKFYAEENGPVGFDAREKNSVQGIINGLKTALEDLGKELTVDHICAIHKSCMTGIVSRNPCIPGELRQNSVSMEVMPGWMSLAGFQDLVKNLPPTSQLMPVRFLTKDGNNLIPLEKVPIQDRNKYKTAAIEREAFTPQNTNEKILNECYAHYSERKISLLYQPPITVTKLRLAMIVKVYNFQIIQANTTDEKLKAIVSLIQQYLRQHPHRDGNNRTLVNDLLNQLLIENGLSPTLLLEPNVFEFHTSDELVAIIKKGQMLFMSIINKPQEPVFNFDNSKIKNIDNGKYVEMGKNFLEELNGLISKLGKAYYQAKEYSLASECFTINVELEKKLKGDESPEIATSLYNLASALKELGQLQKTSTNDITKLREAKSHFNTVVGLFDSNNNKDSLEKARKKIAEIEIFLAKIDAPSDSNILKVPAK